MPHWREHGKCVPLLDPGTTTPVAAGEQPMFAVMVVVAVTVGVGSLVVPPVTLAQQEHAEENFLGEEQCTEAKVGTALGVIVSLPPMRVIVVVRVVLRVVKAAEVEGRTGSVVNLVTVLVTVLQMSCS